MANQTNGSRTDTIVKLVLIFFISLLSFSVGTFVGKQVSDTDHRRASLEQDYKSFRDVAAVDHKEHVPGEHDSAISEEDVANLTEEFIQEEKAKGHKKKGEHQSADSHGTEHQKSDTNVHSDAKITDHKRDDHATPPDKDGYKKYKKGKPVAADRHTPDPKAKDHGKAPKAESAHKKSKSRSATKVAAGHVSSQADRVAQGKAPSKTVKKKRLPSSILPSVATSAIGKYTVQVASYATESEAKTHAANLKWQGFSAFYLPAEVNKKTWYRVSVGLFSNQKSAMNFKADLLKQAGIKSAIIQKIIK